MKYCPNCGKKINEGQDVCLNCGKVLNDVKNETVNNTNGEAKSKIAAGLFAIFFGAFGVHNFYLGYTGKAVAQLLITVLSLGILSGVSIIWAFVEAILILTGSVDKDAKGILLKD